jgi:hypothetical protein
MLTSGTSMPACSYRGRGDRGCLRAPYLRLLLNKFEMLLHPAKFAHCDCDRTRAEAETLA